MLDTSNFNYLWLLVWGAVPVVGWASVWLYNKRETKYEKRIRSLRPTRTLLDFQVDEIVRDFDVEPEHDNCWMCKRQREHGLPDWVNR